MQTIIGYDLAVGAWIAKQLDEKLEKFYPFTAIGFARDGELTGGVLYNNYHGHDIQITSAATDSRWLSKNNLRTIYNYPYNQLGCVRTTAVTGRSNKRARTVLEKLGYRHEGTLRLGLDGKQTALIYGMLKDECKWIK